MQRAPAHICSPAIYGGIQRTARLDPAAALHLQHQQVRQLHSPLPQSQAQAVSRYGMHLLNKLTAIATARGRGRHSQMRMYHKKQQRQQHIQAQLVLHCRAGTCHCFAAVSANFKTSHRAQESTRSTISVVIPVGHVICIIRCWVARLLAVAHDRPSHAEFMSGQWQCSDLQPAWLSVAGGSRGRVQALFPAPP